MRLNEAIALLPGDDFTGATSTQWADLGCGTGLFTTALAHLLMPGSTIYAVDSDATALASVPTHPSVTIQMVQGDFTQYSWSFPALDGILMANSLHYVRDKTAFIQQATQHLIQTGRFLIVEYDTDAANRWVPYPVRYSALEILFKNAGASLVRKIAERPSRYNQGTMYSALVEF